MGVLVESVLEKKRMYAHDQNEVFTIDFQVVQAPKGTYILGL